MFPNDYVLEIKFTSPMKKMMQMLWQFTHIYRLYRFYTSFVPNQSEYDVLSSAAEINSIDFGIKLFRFKRFCKLRIVIRI